MAVCDKDQEKLDLVASHYENVNTYTEITNLIRNEDIDAVSIVTPPKYIPEIAQEFAQEGIDILMEKPMALELEQLMQFKKFDIRIMPGFIELFNPVFEKLLDHLDEIGEIISLASKRIGLYPRRAWHMGVILDLAIHDIYLQEKVMKRKVEEVHGFKKCFKDDEHADAAFIILDFGNAIGNIESNWLTPSKFRRMYVNGEDGGIMIDFITQEIKMRKGLHLQEEWPVTKEVGFKPLRMDEPLKREINNFLYDKEALVTLDDGIKALKIALKVVNS
jgi:predicted dehydrogenase